jgi:hypothetical protein
MATGDQPRDGWTVVLRRQPARIVHRWPEGGYTDLSEIICCECGDDPGLDYSAVSPVLQQVRGPYPIADGITRVRDARPAGPPAGAFRQHGTATDAG